MFHWENGLFLTRNRLALDVPRPQACGWVSHAHGDHLARHAFTLCTPATARLVRMRYGPRPIRELPLGTPTDWGELQLTAFQAGHCLGSAMLLADDGQTRLLYTGDFKLRASATAGAAEVPRADILVMEATFGDPKYRFPPRETVAEQLCAIVAETLCAGRAAVVGTYPLGKAQEAAAILSRAGYPVFLHRMAWAASSEYAAEGIDLDAIRPLGDEPLERTVAIVPPRYRRGDPERETRIALSGWALHPQALRRLGADYALPLSDHADFDELLETVERVAPRVVYGTHGMPGLIDHLRARGYAAHWLGAASDRGAL